MSALSAQRCVRYHSFPFYLNEEITLVAIWSLSLLWTQNHQVLIPYLYYMARRGGSHLPKGVRSRVTAGGALPWPPAWSRTPHQWPPARDWEAGRLRGRACCETLWGRGEPEGICSLPPLHHIPRLVDEGWGKGSSTLSLGRTSQCCVISQVASLMPKWQLQSWCRLGRM